MTDDDTRENVLPGSDETLDTPDVRGYDFRGEFDFFEMLDAYATTGFQATHLAEGVDITREMHEDDATVYLTFTSNIVSSGLREVVAHLVREGYVDVIITTSGSLTEDVIKTARPFKMGEWDADEAALRGGNQPPRQHLRPLGPLRLAGGVPLRLLRGILRRGEAPHPHGVRAGTRRDPRRRGLHPEERCRPRRPRLLSRPD